MDFGENLTYILCFLAVVILIVSNIELMLCKNKSKFAIEIPKEVVILQPEKFGIRYPMYIYNSSNIKRKDIKFLPTYTDKTYVKYDIPIHVASKINAPLVNAWNGIKQLPYSKMPINTLYSAVNNSDSFMASINPINGGDKSKYKLLISTFDDNKIELFIDDRIYFM